MDKCNLKLCISLPVQKKCHQLTENRIFDLTTLPNLTVKICIDYIELVNYFTLLFTFGIKNNIHLTLLAWQDLKYDSLELLWGMVFAIADT
jgi:hypothetical protein